MIEQAKIYKGKEVLNTFFDSPQNMADHLGYVVTFNPISPICPKAVFEKRYDANEYFRLVNNFINENLDCDINDLSNKELEFAEVELFKKELYKWLQTPVQDWLDEGLTEIGAVINTETADVRFWYNPDTITNHQRIEFGLSFSVEKPTQYWEETENYENYMNKKENF